MENIFLNKDKVVQKMRVSLLVPQGHDVNFHYTILRYESVNKSTLTRLVVSRFPSTDRLTVFCCVVKIVERRRDVYLHDECFFPLASHMHAYRIVYLHTYAQTIYTTLEDCRTSSLEEKVRQTKNKQQQQQHRICILKVC